MTNQFILALANRTIDDPALMAPGPFNPSIPSAQLAGVRQAMGLDNHDTTWYLQHLLAAVHAFPWLLAATGETKRTYDTRLRTRTRDTCTPGTLVAASGDLRTAWEPSTLPTTFTRTLTRLDATRAVFEGQTVRASLDTELVLRVDWPSDSGLQCGVRFQATADWTSGGPVSITTEPVLYPWDHVADIGGTSDGHRILDETGMLQFWHAATDPFARVAVLATAVALANKAVYADN